MLVEIRVLADWLIGDTDVEAGLVPNVVHDIVNGLDVRNSLLLLFKSHCGACLSKSSRHLGTRLVSVRNIAAGKRQIVEGASLDSWRDP